MRTIQTSLVSRSHVFDGFGFLQSHLTTMGVRSPVHGNLKELSIRMKFWFLQKLGQHVILVPIFKPTK